MKPAFGRENTTILALYAFVVGLGIQLSLNTFFGAITYYEARFGNAALLRITFACYVASLPVSTAVNCWNSSTSAVHHAVQRDVALSIFCSGCSGILLALAPMASALTTVLGLCVVLGGLCTLQYCVAYRLVMLLEQNCLSNGWLEVGLSFGFQSSVFVVLAAKRIVGFQVWNDLPVYFIFCASVHLLSILAALGLARAGLTRGNEPDGGNEHELVPLKVGGSREQRSQSSQNEGHAYKESSSSSSLRRRSADFEPVSEESRRFVPSHEGRTERRFITTDAYLCMALLLTVFASVYIFAFFGFVPSQYARDKDFSGNLVTVKLVSDAFARPLSLLTTKPWCSAKCLALLSIVRLVVGSLLFFLYTFTKIMYRNNMIVYAFVAVYSASSGLIITAAYQLGRLKGGPVIETSTRVNRMNLSFQSGLSLALVVSFVIESTCL